MSEAIRLTMIGASLAGIGASIYIMSRAVHKCAICEEWCLSCRPTEWGYHRRIVSACAECRGLKILIKAVEEGEVYRHD